MRLWAAWVRLRAMWRWWARGACVYRVVNTTGSDRVFQLTAVDPPVLLQPGETLEVTVYPHYEERRDEWRRMERRRRHV